MSVKRNEKINDSFIEYQNNFDKKMTLLRIKQSNYSQHEKISTSSFSNSDRKTNVGPLLSESKLKEKSFSIHQRLPSISSIKPLNTSRRSENTHEPNLSKFYLEFNDLHSPFRRKALNKDELSDLFGKRILNEDSSIQKMIENYPDYYFLDYDKLKINNLSNTSRANVPNSFLDPFSIRKSMIDLTLWLDKISLKIIEDKKSDIDSQVFNMQKAFKICIENIALHISQKCNEGGILLIQIWDMIIDMVNLTFKKYNHERQKLENDFKKNVNVLKDLYGAKIINLENELKETQNALREMKSSNDNLIEQRDFHKNKEIVSEKLRKRLDFSLNELKLQYERIFLENLKFKIEYENETFQQEIYKKAFDEIVKSHREKHITIVQKKNQFKIENLYKQLTSNEFSKTEIKQINSSFIKEITNLSFSLIDPESDLNDKDKVDALIEEVHEFLRRDAMVDTQGLQNELKSKAISTNEDSFKRYLYREQEAQTVLFDEIEESETLIPSIDINSDTLFEEKARVSVFQRSSKKNLTKKLPSLQMRKRMFTFNLETQTNLHHLKELQGFTLTKLCDYYSQEMIKFYEVINNSVEETIEEKEEVDWMDIYDKICKNKICHEQFMDTLYKRDSLRMKEILDQKIELIQQKIDTEQMVIELKNSKNRIDLYTQKYQDFIMNIFQANLDKENQKNEERFSPNLKPIKEMRKRSLKPGLDNKKLIKTLGAKGKRKYSFDLNMTEVDFLGKQELNKSNLSNDLNKKKKMQVELKITNNFEIRNSFLDEKLLNEEFKFITNKKVLAKVNCSHFNEGNNLFIKLQILARKNENEVEKKKGGVKLKSILKLINPIFLDLLKKINNFKDSENINLNPFFFIFYEFLFSHHGMNKEICEAKYVKLVQSSFFFSNNPRIRNFLKLLGLGNKENSIDQIADGSDVFFYFNCLKQLDDMNISSNFLYGTSFLLSVKESQFVGLYHALEIFTNYAKLKLTNEKYKIKIEDMINKIKATKVIDPLVSRKYVVDVDFIIEKMFWVRNEVLNKYFDIFQSVDLDKDNSININEFIFLMRNVERKRLDYIGILKVFKTECDLIDSERNLECISFKRFSNICEKINLLSENSINIFEKSINDDINTLELLEKEWGIKKNLIKLKFIKTNTYSSFYSNILKSVEEYFQLEKAKITNEQKKIAWIQYRLIEEESKTVLLDFETELCIPREFTFISKNLY